MAQQHVCPWWGGYFIDNRLRRLIHNPQKLLGPYVHAGMTVMDVGCGMGLFSIAMAKMVGSTGKVISVDLQPQMLRVLQRRARQAGVADRIRTHLCQPDTIGVQQPVDFALAFAMVHEVPDQQQLLREIGDCLRHEGRFFIAEPRGHVPEEDFQKTLTIAEQFGLKITDEPKVRWCHAALLQKSATGGSIRA